MLGVKLQTQYHFIYGELGRKPLKYTRLIGLIRFWLKIIESDETKFIKCTYNMMLNDIERQPQQKNWAKSIKSLLENVGLNYAWTYQQVGDKKLFLNLFKTRTNDQFIQNWNSQLDNSSRAKTYCLLAKFSFKPYLDIINVKKFRFELTRLRVSSHRLAVETGRWHKPQPIPQNERKCIVCNTLEDEFHFVIECPLYKTARSKYIKPYFWKRSNVPKFVELLNNENKNIIRNLSMYIFESQKIRTELLYSD